MTPLEWIGFALIGTILIATITILLVVIINIINLILNAKILKNLNHVSVFTEEFSQTPKIKMQSPCKSVVNSTPSLIVSSTPSLNEFSAKKSVAKKKEQQSIFRKLFFHGNKNDKTDKTDFSFPDDKKVAVAARLPQH